MHFRGTCGTSRDFCSFFFAPDIFWTEKGPYSKQPGTVFEGNNRKEEGNKKEREETDRLVLCPDDHLLGIRGVRTKYGGGERKILIFVYYATPKLRLKF